jgi:hypothetical protein
MSLMTSYNYSTLTTLEFEVGEIISFLFPQIDPPQTAGSIQFSVSPVLPEGLNCNPTTGVISGAATTVSPQTAYTFTATNASGSISVVLYISIYDACPTVECGCGQGIFSNLVEGVVIEKDYLSAETGEILQIENFTGSGFVFLDGESLELN